MWAIQRKKERFSTIKTKKVMDKTSLDTKCEKIFRLINVKANNVVHGVRNSTFLVRFLAKNLKPKRNGQRLLHI